MNRKTTLLFYCYRSYIIIMNNIEGCRFIKGGNDKHEFKEGVQKRHGFFDGVRPAKLDHTCRCKSGHGNRQ